MKPGTLVAFGYLQCTQEQARYAKDLVMREAQRHTLALGLGASGRRSLGGGFISIELRDESRPLPPVRRVFEDEVRRDVTCPHCTLDQTVLGLATARLDSALSSELATFRTHRSGGIAG